MAANDNDPDALAVTLTQAQLRSLVREAVREELGKGASAPPEYLSTDEVATLIGCTTVSIAKYCERDGMPCVRIGRMRRFLRDDVLAWLEERRSKPRAHKARHVQAIANVRQFSK